MRIISASSNQKSLYLTLVPGWYLEACSWNPADAIKLYRSDEEVRQKQQPALHAVVNNLAREVARANLTANHLSFYMLTAQGHRFVAMFCTFLQFNKAVNSHINALNQWRTDLNRKQERSRSIHKPPYRTVLRI